jgi:PAS domain S-box-containing protein
MRTFEWLWDERRRGLPLAIGLAFTLLVAAIDWWTKPYVAFGFLYLFPVILAAAFLPRWVAASFAITCALLAEAFGYLPPSFVRLTFEILALAGSGLVFGEVIRRTRSHRLESQAKFEALVETSPAAIVIVDQLGFIESANRAAVELMAPRAGRLIGNPIAAFLPELHHALRWEEARFRASMECPARRGSGDVFTATVWFSTYKEGPAHKLAAIIAEVTSEEAEEEATAAVAAVADLPSPESFGYRGRAPLNTRETEVLQLLVQGLANKEIAVRMKISESVVKNTIQHLFSKLGVRSRSQLVRVALERHETGL